MFIDTSFNTVPTVLANLYQSFREAAVRCFAYNRSLSKVRPTHSRLLISEFDPQTGKGHRVRIGMRPSICTALAIKPRATLPSITDQVNHRND